MVEKQLISYCENCNKETNQVVSEDAFEIKYHCKECDTDKKEIKTYF